MHSHLREAGLTPLWCIQGAITATSTVVGIDKITKGPLQWGFNGWTFHFILLPNEFWFFGFFFLTE
jgi:hypothetical protein